MRMKNGDIVYLFIFIAQNLIILLLFMKTSSTRNETLIQPKEFRLPFQTISPEKISRKKGFLERRTHATQINRFIKIILNPYFTKHKYNGEMLRRQPAHGNVLKLLLFRGHPAAGIGDHIRGLLYAVMISIFTRRHILLDVNIPHPLHEVLESRGGLDFDYDNETFFIEDNSGYFRAGVINDSSFVSIRDYMKSARVIVQHRTPPFNIEEFINNREVLSTVFGTDVLNQLSDFSPSTFEVAPFILQQMFKPSLELKKRLSRRWPFRGAPYISLHARLGHGVGETSGRFDTSTVGITVTSLARCIGRYAGIEAKRRNVDNVFISTDTRALNRYLYKGVRDEFAHVDVEIANGVAMHTSKLSVLPRHKSREAFFRAFVDIGILGGGSSVISIRSGFIHVAQWIGAITEGVSVTMENCTTEWKNL